MTETKHLRLLDIDLDVVGLGVQRIRGLHYQEIPEQNNLLRKRTSNSTPKEKSKKRLYKTSIKIEEN